jgi:hypothetical protein
LHSQTLACSLFLDDEEDTMWLVMIWLHASAGVLGLALGLYLVLRPAAARLARWPVTTHVVLIAVLVVALIAAVALHWPELESAQRIAFSGLTLLGLYTLVRAGQAASLTRRHPGGRHGEFVQHVGFTLISLFDGFVIVGAIDLGAPTWAVIALGAGGVVAGIRFVRSRVERVERVASRSAPR